MAGADLKLHSRGNIWALYKNPKKLKFTSDTEELRFWSRNGISKSIPGLKGSLEQSSQEAYEAFRSGHADIIWNAAATSTLGNPSARMARRLYACFGEQRERVRALTERLLTTGIAQSAA